MTGRQPDELIETRAAEVAEFLAHISIAQRPDFLHRIAEHLRTTHRFTLAGAIDTAARMYSQTNEFTG